MASEIEISAISVLARDEILPVQEIRFSLTVIEEEIRSDYSCYVNLVVLRRGQTSLVSCTFFMKNK